MGEFPRGPFGAALVDPAWPFRTFDGDTSVPTQAADPYETMPLEDMMALPVASEMAQDAALFMWTVDAHLEDAIALAKAWGFEFKTVAFIWLKMARNPDQVGMFPGPPEFRLGMGYWTRKQGELCLLFTRGSPKRLSKGVRQVIASPRREHSRKPEEQYERVEALVGGPYLEMFARTSRPGWTAWGNEVEKFGE